MLRWWISKMKQMCYFFVGSGKCGRIMLEKLYDDDFLEPRCFIMLPMEVFQSESNENAIHLSFFRGSNWWFFKWKSPTKLNQRRPRRKSVMIQRQNHRWDRHDQRWFQMVSAQAFTNYDRTDFAISTPAQFNDGTCCNIITHFHYVYVCIFFRNFSKILASSGKLID